MSGLNNTEFSFQSCNVFTSWPAYSIPFRMMSNNNYSLHSVFSTARSGNLITIWCSSILNYLITCRTLHFLFLTETCFKFVPRLTGSGGGIADVFQNHFSFCSIISFEILTFEIVWHDPICCQNIYWPPIKYGFSWLILQVTVLFPYSWWL